MKKTNPNTEVAALKQTVKLKDAALSELAHDNLILSEKLQKAGVALGEVQEKGRIAELALGGVRDLRASRAALAAELQETKAKVTTLRKINGNRAVALADAQSSAKWYRNMALIMVTGNIITAAVLCVKFWI